MGGALEVSVSGVKLKNPIIPASGVYGFGGAFRDFYDPNILGAIAVKGTTRNARLGNPLPRAAECPSGMLNSVGLQNPGIDWVLSTELPNLQSFYTGPVIANISGFSAEEYVYCCERMDGNADIIELNISCPNVHGGGMSFGADAKMAEDVTRAVRSVIGKSRLYVKLSPNVGDISEIARACEGAGADGISLINTLLSMRIDIKTQKPVLANITGGLSGSAIFPLALRMVYDVYHAVKIPVMGMGGVSCAEDVIEMMMAGAAAVQIGAENLRNPMVCSEIIEKLPALMDRLGIKRLSDITGAA